MPVQGIKILCEYLLLSDPGNLATMTTLTTITFRASMFKLAMVPLGATVRTRHQ